MKIFLQILGGLTLAAVIVVSSTAAAHLWEDHKNYHTNMQLLELIRATVVEIHPELEETNEQESTP